jgi:hypothetical protein
MRCDLAFMNAIFCNDVFLVLDQSEIVVAHHTDLLLAVVRQDSCDTTVTGADTVLTLLRQASFADARHFCDASHSWTHLLERVESRRASLLLGALPLPFGDECDGLLRALMKGFLQGLQPRLNILASAFTTPRRSSRSMTRDPRAAR